MFDNRLLNSILSQSQLRRLLFLNSRVNGAIALIRRPLGPRARQVLLTDLGLNGRRALWAIKFRAVRISRANGGLTVFILLKLSVDLGEIVAHGRVSLRMIASGLNAGLLRPSGRRRLFSKRLMLVQNALQRVLLLV